MTAGQFLRSTADGTLRSVGSGSPSIGQVWVVLQFDGGKPDSTVKRRDSKATYSNGRGERSQAALTDLNVPLGLTCELVSGDRWSNAAAP